MVKDKAAAALKELKQQRAEFKNDVRSEFRKQALTAITAALALVIALSWRTPIELATQALLGWFGIPPEGIYPKILAAIIITLFAASALVILARWAQKDAPKSEK